MSGFGAVSTHAPLCTPTPQISSGPLQMLPQPGGVPQALLGYPPPSLPHAVSQSSAYVPGIPPVSDSFCPAAPAVPVTSSLPSAIFPIPDYVPLLPDPPSLRVFPSSSAALLLPFLLYVFLLYLFPLRFLRASLYNL